MTRTEVETFVRNMDTARAWLEGKPIQVKVGVAQQASEWDTYQGSDPNFSSPRLQWRIKPKESELQVLKRQLEAAIELEAAESAATTDGVFYIGDFRIERRRP